MIPFNRLGLPFKLFSRFVYPKKALDDISSLLEEVRPESFVLDIGSGTGVLTEFAHNIRDDLKYVSLDPAYGMIKYAPEYTYKVRAKAESLPFKNIFSVVLMGDTIHHIDNPHKAIMEIKGCMTPSGRLFIFDLNPDTFIGSVVCRSERFFKEPANFYSPEILSDMLKRYGFRTKINKYDWRYSVEAELI
ncbi:MAG: class I SAM-dependent methyltransferase [Thermoclostridium sp.]|nr:class I SAM-dependent methyltransferase [Thermoclostridium sp.]